MTKCTSSPIDTSLFIGLPPFWIKPTERRIARGGVLTVLRSAFTTFTLLTIAGQEGASTQCPTRQGRTCARLVDVPRQERQWISRLWLPRERPHGLQRREACPAVAGVGPVVVADVPLWPAAFVLPADPIVGVGGVIAPKMVLDEFIAPC